MATLVTVICSRATLKFGGGPATQPCAETTQPASDQAVTASKILQLDGICWRSLEFASFMVTVLVQTIFNTDITSRESRKETKELARKIGKYNMLLGKLVVQNS
jgi:hypothetical protein